MILIDANNVGFAATATTLSKRASQKAGVTLSMLFRIRQYVDQEPGQVFCLWDGRSWRYDLFPAYKANRDDNPELVKIKQRWVTERPIVQEALRRLGVRQLAADNLEADDLAARLVKRFDGKSIKLITGDRDWLQLVRPGVTWHDPVRDRICTIENFSDHARIGHGENNPRFYTPWEFIQGKALVGDKGDNIGGVGGIGPTRAREMIVLYGSVAGLLNESLMHTPDKPIPGYFRKFLEDEGTQERYRRNLRLVWLNHPDVPATQNLVTSAPPPNIPAFLDLCEKLGFVQIVAKAERFVEPFIRTTAPITAPTPAPITASISTHTEIAA